MVSSTVNLPDSRSMWRGLRAMSWPQRRPVIAVSTMSRCWAGRALRMAEYSAGVRVRLVFLILGSPGPPHSGSGPPASPT